MKLTFQAVAQLPKLAWLADVDAAHSTARVVHGPLVEVRAGFFVEGVWDSDFPSGAFANTDCVFGSGGTIDGDGLTFVSSASTTDYLYYREDAGRVTVANSLPLLLAYGEDRLDPAFADYGAINQSILRGIDQYIRTIPTRGGSVQRLMYRNLRVSAAGAAQLEKPKPPSFPTYEAYLGYLQSRYTRIAANARDGARRQPMQILSTQSRGYDTTALNAIAAPFGIDMAFTVTRSKVAGVFATRETHEGVSDDGTEICAVLGIPCTPIDRRSFQGDLDDEHLYHATLDGNEDLNMREIARHVSQVSVLLTGTLGELWYPPASYELYVPHRHDALKRADVGGHGLTEVRLAAGIVHLPFPYIGAQRRLDIVAITESSAMDPWRIRTAYDRPIPRRMAEEAGVPRAMFGQRKMATVVEFPPPPVPYGAALRQEYFDFLLRNRLLRAWQLPLFPLVHRVNAILWFANEQRYPWMHYLQRAITKLLRRDFRFAIRWQRLNGRLFCFSANRRADEYARMLAPTGAESAAMHGAPVSSRADGSA